MASQSWHSVIVLFGLICAAVPAFLSSPAEAQLQLKPDFYQKSCPQLYPIAGTVVRSAIQKEPRIAASLLRLHFHDCFVQGCDASVLLDGANTEQITPPNRNSLRGFGVVDDIKTAVENACPGVVSCADILALASFFSIILSGGPAWPIPLGRRDSLSAAPPNLATNLPAPFFTVAQLKASFRNQNLTATDLVALSGGHTIGLARCVVIQGRLFPGDPVLNTTLLNTLRKLCPQNGNGNFSVAMEPSPLTFDNLYFKGLLRNEGIFSSDQNLTVDSDTNRLVHTYANDQVQFFTDFATGMRKMGNLNVLTGTQGQIRKKCGVPNPTRRPFVEEILTHPQTVIEEVSKEVGDMFKGFIKSVVKEIVGDDFEKLMEHSNHLNMVV